MLALRSLYLCSVPVLHRKSSRYFCLFISRNYQSSDSGKLGLTIKRIESDMAQHELEKIGGFVDFSPDNFWGLGNRIVAIESLLNISSQMERIRPLLEKIIPENRKLFFQTFFANAVKGTVIRFGFYGSLFRT